MIEIKVNRGFIIKPLYFDEIKKIVEARLAIEGYSSSILAEKLHDKDPKAISLVADLEQNLIKQGESLKTQNPQYDFMITDLEFHQSIIDFTQNNYFAEIIKMLRTRLEIATLKSLLEKNRLSEALDEHWNLINSIKTGDKQKAFQAYDFHMQKTLEIMRQCYDT